MQNLQNASSSSKPRIGLIQSRGLGDIVIALPIAKWYHDRGYEVVWPIDEKFYPSFKDTINYVSFIPFKFQPTITGFYAKPLEILNTQNCEKIINLYSFLSNLPVYRKKLSSSLSFDQYKYAISKVPFKEKWNLIIKRNIKNETELFNKKIENDDYILIHDTGSNIKASINIPQKYKEYQKIIIDETTQSIFDWLYIIEKAKCLFMIDSCFSNLVDQLQINTEKYFILRSSTPFTPVLKSQWNYINK
jgi:hypothetical protein